jgi:hypothetical protein
MPEDMAGKQVRCPLCSHVFQVSGPGPAPSQPGPPPPPARGEYDYDQPGPRSGPPSRPGGYDERRGGYDEPRGYDEARGGYDSYSPYQAAGRNSAAVWLLIAGILDLLVLLIFYVFVFTVDRRPPPPDAIFLITLFALIFYIAPLVFLFIAAGVVRGRGTGLVITGSVMAFVLAFELLFLVGGFAIALLVSLSSPFRHERVPATVPIIVLVGLAALVISIIAGVRALMAISVAPPRRRDYY